MIAGGSKCALADRECRGRLEWHHAIKQQRLRREFRHGARYVVNAGRWYAASRYDPVLEPGPGCKTLDQILADPRNRIWICAYHHELVTNTRLRVVIPDAVWRFAADFGLTAQLENDLARQPVGASQ